MGVRWFRNLPLKLGALALAALGMLGFYGIVQANPLAHASSQSQAQDPSATQPAATPPTPATGGLAPRSSIPQQRPAPAPMPRARRSRGS